MKVYLTEKIHDDALSFLRAHFEVICGYLLPEDDHAAAMAESDGVLVRSAQITAEMIEQMPKLKVIAKHGIGVDNIDVEAAGKRAVKVVNAPLANVNAVAEHTVALLFAASKRLCYLDRRVRSGGFAERGLWLNTELAGRTVGLVGFGKIARLVAKKLSALDMEILTSDPYCDLDAAKALNVQCVEMDELLSRSDFVSLHTPLMPATRAMVNEAFLRKMKPSAVLINASRGGVVDEAALIRALKEQIIAGAALDVFDPEPPRPDNPLFSMEQVVLSPHNAALTDRAMLAMSMDSAAGVCDVLEGRAPRFPVN